MFRLISFLLLLAGLGIAALGAMRMSGAELPLHRITGEPAPAPSPLAEPETEEVALPEPVVAAPPPVDAMTETPPALEASPEPVLAPSVEPERIEDPKAKQNSTERTVATRSLGSSEPSPAPIVEETPPAPEPMVQPQASMRMAPPEPEPSLMDQLRTVPIAHETPKQATFGRPFSVTMAINAAEDATTATDALPGTGNVVEAEAQVSDTVRAIVAGEAFSVEAVSPATQKLSPLTENVWRWSVTPLKAGPQELVIEIYAVDEGEALPVRTFRDTVTVEISRFGQAVALAQEANPLIMVLAGIGSMFAGIFGVARFFRGR